ncbi:MAG: hypothetical protein Q7I98_04095, partial [Erysipelotrichaceae bacterium]|nr:hypothetical protein [Erysipelotrichaceae bacterium]
KLLPNYEGNDIVELQSIFTKKAPSTKDEFETTAEYEKKIASIVTYDIYAFKLDPYSSYSSGLTVHSYDADTKKIKIAIKTKPLSRYDFEDCRSSMIIKNIDHGITSSYVGTNAFGAKVLVKTVRKTEYGIALTNQNEFGISDYDGHGEIYKKTGLTDSFLPLKGERRLDYEFSMEPNEAKTMKDNIGILILCKPILYKLKSDHWDHRKDRGEGYYFAFEKLDGSSATLDRPVDLIYDKKFINVEALAIWIYNIKSGEILLKNNLEIPHQIGH